MAAAASVTDGDSSPATAGAEKVSQLRQAFNSGYSKPVEWRRHQLRAIVNMMVEEKEALCEALRKDLYKHKIESLIFEVDFVKNEAIYALNNLDEWMKTEKVKKGFLNIADSCFIRKEPIGVALIIGAWNYPVQLILVPLIGAVAAGNTVVLKPSEVSAHTEKLFMELIPQYLDTRCIAVVSGGVQETTELLKERFDYIFYTGSSVVGKVVMTAAAKHLTPVTLELGGKSPAYVDNNCNLSVVAKRLLWGKCTNSGQTCVAPDYVMCPNDLQEQLIENFKAAIEEFYQGNIKESPYYPRIISDRRFQHLKKILDTHKPAFGGEMREEERLMTPAFLTDVRISDPVMQEEIFGPIFPIVPVGSSQEAVEFINSQEKPLSLYVFSNNKKTIKQFLENTSSGSICVNDVLIQGVVPTLPFGGVGYSGMGSYHGKFSFDTFTHKKACLVKDLKLESLNSLRYPPYTEKKYKWLTWLMEKKLRRGGILSLAPFVLLGSVLTIVCFIVQKNIPLAGMK